MSTIHEHLRSFHARAIKWLSPLSNTLSIVAAIGIAAGTAFLLAIGPAVQQHLVGLLNESGPTIYSTSFKDSLVSFPSLRVWISQSFFAPYALSGIIIAIFSLRQPTARGVFFTASAATAASIYLSDIVFGLIYFRVDASYVFENLLFDILGGFAIGAAVLSFVIALSRLRSWFPKGRRFFLLFSILIPSLSGLFLSLLVYYVTKLFYEPVPVSIDLTASPPIAVAVTGSESATTTSDGKTLEPFRPIPQSIGNSPLDITDVQSELRLRWKGHSAAGDNSLALKLFDGCYSQEDIDKNSASAKASEIKLDDTLEMNFDLGTIDVELPQSSLEGDDVDVFVAQPLQLRLDQTEKKDHVKLQVFAAKDSEVLVASRNTVRTLVAHVYLLRFGESDKTSTMSRTLRLLVNGTTTEIQFLPRPQLPPEEKLNCSAIDTQVKVGQRTVIQSRGFMVSVVVTLRTAISSIDDIPSQPSQLRISGINGWISASDVDGGSTLPAESAPLKALQLIGNISRFEIDEEIQDSHPLDYWTLNGHLLPAYDGTGSLRVRGTAQQLWKNQSRINPTRWERLKAEARAFVLSLLGLIGIAALGMIRALWKAISTDERLKALAPTRQQRHQSRKP